MVNATDFATGQRVIYQGRAQNRLGVPYAGKLATVIRPIKSRKVVHIRWDATDEPSFESKPDNLTLAP